jgi:transcriptional regulator with XRE-family HTH domain
VSGRVGPCRAAIHPRDKRELSATRYTMRMTPTRIDLTPLDLAASIGGVIRSNRLLVGWSQRHLADLAGTSQAMIWRLETAQPGPIGVDVTERVLAALGLRATLELNDLALQDRQRQRDGVHAVLNGFVARRLTRHAWVAPTEVLVGVGRPRGWIDLLGYREEDRALLVEETKCDLPDMGGLQRRLAFYAREARAVAAGLGWHPRRVVVLVVGLDTASMGARLADNRDLIRQSFPAPIDEVARWLADPSARPPSGWAFALADPAVRGERWLRPVPLGARRRPPAYVDYADAARRLLRS